MACAACTDLGVSRPRSCKWWTSTTNHGKWPFYGQLFRLRASSPKAKRAVKLGYETRRETAASWREKLMMVLPAEQKNQRNWASSARQQPYDVIRETRMTNESEKFRAKEMWPSECVMVQMVACYSQLMGVFIWPIHRTSWIRKNTSNPSAQPLSGLPYCCLFGLPKSSTLGHTQCRAGSRPFGTETGRYGSAMVKHWVWMIDVSR